MRNALAVTALAVSIAAPAWAEPAATSRLDAQAAKLRAAWIEAGRALPTAPPTITAGNILTPTVNIASAPAAPKFLVKYTVGAPGIYAVVLSLYVPTTGQTLSVDYYPAPPYKTPAATGSLTLEYPANNIGPSAGFSRYAGAGAWPLYGACIYDVSGASSCYNQTQIAALFPVSSITVVNSKSDTAAPAAVSGKILTPTVSLASTYHSFAASVKVTDNLSGVATVYIALRSPTGASYGNSRYVSAPITNGSFEYRVALPASAATGTYTITSYNICDFAGNCAGSSDANVIKTLLGKSSFTVAP